MQFNSIPAWDGLSDPWVILLSRRVQTWEGGAKSWIVSFWWDMIAYAEIWNGEKGKDGSPAEGYGACNSKNEK